MSPFLSDSNKRQKNVVSSKFYTEFVLMEFIHWRLTEQFVITHSTESHRYYLKANGLSKIEECNRGEFK